MPREDLNWAGLTDLLPLLSFFIQTWPAELQSHLTLPPWKAHPLMSLLSSKRRHRNIFLISLKWRSGGRLSKLVLVERFGHAQHLKIKDWAEYQCDHQWFVSGYICNGMPEDLNYSEPILLSLLSKKLRYFFFSSCAMFTMWKLSWKICFDITSRDFPLKMFCPWANNSGLCFWL